MSHRHPAVDATKIFQTRKNNGNREKTVYEELFQLQKLGDKEHVLAPSPEDWQRIEKSYMQLLSLINSENKIYGIHTSYGENVRNKVDHNAWRNTQSDLLAFLNVGVGNKLPDSVVRRALKLQAIKMSYGLSGIHPKTYEALIQLSNQDDMPIVPCKGSLGASGDLMPMAHAVSSLFKANGPLGPRDVICLVNTNAMMSAYAIELFHQVNSHLDYAYLITALISAAMGLSNENYSADGLGKGNVHASYRLAGEITMRLREELLNNTSAQNAPTSLLQPRYSLRCAPQILGNCEDLLLFAGMKIRSEATAIADNPLIIENKDDNKVTPWHGGLFYAAGIATAADAMLDVVAKISEMIDRQILNVVDSNLNGGLPDNLFVQGKGHVKGIHMLTSALCQEIRSLSTPSRLFSFSCEGNNQDLVPCGMTILNNVARSVETVKEITRAGLFAGARALTLRLGQNLPSFLELSQWPNFRAEDVAKLAVSTSTSRADETLPDTWHYKTRDGRRISITPTKDLHDLLEIYSLRLKAFGQKIDPDYQFKVLSPNIKGIDEIPVAGLIDELDASAFTLVAKDEQARIIGSARFNVFAHMPDRDDKGIPKFLNNYLSADKLDSLKMEQCALGSRLLATEDVVLEDGVSLREKLVLLVNKILKRQNVENCFTFSSNSGSQHLFKQLEYAPLGSKPRSGKPEEVIQLLSRKTG